MVHRIWVILGVIRLIQSKCDRVKLSLIMARGFRRFHQDSVFSLSWRTSSRLSPIDFDTISSCCVDIDTSLLDQHMRLFDR